MGRKDNNLYLNLTADYSDNDGVHVNKVLVIEVGLRERLFIRL